MYDSELYELVQKYKIPNFLGIFMKDELMNNFGVNNILKLPNNTCCIINFQTSKEKGSHWVCFYVIKNQTYYFDSYGNRPPVKVNCIYNTFRVQYDPVNCGLYCLYILVKCFKYKEKLLDVCLNLK